MLISWMLSWEMYLWSSDGNRRCLSVTYLYQIMVVIPGWGGLRKSGGSHVQLDHRNRCLDVVGMSRARASGSSGVGSRQG